MGTSASSLNMPVKVIPTDSHPLKQWKKDDMGDYIISIDRTAESIPLVEGRIIRCPITTKWKYQWRTKQRWLLLVNYNFYGFWDTLHEAAERFDKDCVPKGNCPDCGLPNGSQKCCQNSDIWK